jgi:O-antigen/teichoic acid export membrane protein
MTTPSSSISGSDAKRAARNVSALVFASLISKGALFIWQLILAPWLGTFDYGIYGTVGALIAVAGSVSSFSMGLIVIRDVAREPQKAGKYWSALMIWQTLLALVAYVGMNVFAIGYSETVQVFTALAGLNLFVDLFGNMGYDLLIAREAMFKTSVVEIVHIIVRIGLSIVALSLGWGLLGVYLASMVSGLGRSIVFVYLNWRMGTRPQFPFDRAIGIPLLVNSAPLALSAFLTLAYQHADKLMTTGILGEEGTGYLTVAFVVIFGVIELFSTTVLVAMYPLMSRYYADGLGEMFGYMVEKLALYMVMVSLPMALTISIFANDITTPLFGADFAPTAGILSILIWYAMITMVGNVFSKGMLIQNRQRLLLIFRAGGLVLNIILNTILLYSWRDPRGAAVASIFAEVLVVALMIGTFRAVGWRWKTIAPSIIRLLVIAGVVGALMVLLQPIHVVVAIVVSLSVYSVAVLMGGVLRASDWDLVYRIVAAMPGGALITRYWHRDVNLSW